jgi:hypothetical protein
VQSSLASYSVSRGEIGRLSAKYDQHILTGVNPKDLPVEGVDKIDPIINLKTATLGLIRFLRRLNLAATSNPARLRLTASGHCASVPQLSPRVYSV